MDFACVKNQNYVYDFQNASFPQTFEKLEPIKHRIMLCFYDLEKETDKIAIHKTQI